jgi:ABC-type dipeptide/oligopeptide/nickel transport system ATPase subunit
MQLALSRFPAISPTSGVPTFRRAATILEIRSLTKHFPAKRAEHHFWRRARQSWLHAVDNVDFRWDLARWWVLVGSPVAASRPWCGSSRAEIGGVLARKFARVTQRSGIQMVFQDAGESLNPRFTAF